MKPGLYARVSTIEQDPSGQIEELTRYVTARGWTGGTLYVDHGTSGATDTRPSLDTLVSDVQARRLDVVVCTKLDRLARSVRHLVNLAAEFQALGVGLVVIDQALDTTTPAGRLLFHVLAAIAEFERELIGERVRAGVRRAIARTGRWGASARPIDMRRLAQLQAEGKPVRAIARILGVPRTTLQRRLAAAGRT